MLILIIGGSSSGKSAYAERYITNISNECRKYYIATMQTFDRECQLKIEKHRKLRSGKGFYTIEQHLKIEEALGKMSLLKDKRTALLECMSNLVANEMFLEEYVVNSNTVIEKIIWGIEQLNKELKHLVIVTNNVFEDGVIYDKQTMEYIKTMGNINEKLCNMADKVIEVVVGIPIILKEDK